jgi:flavin reductase (DIM6/NTAB) family NADH-FMN oxidoreductase RutF
MTPYDLSTETLAAEGLRAGMRRLAASVCVITAVDSSGQRQAMTATSVTSVSDAPASLLVCVNAQSSLHDTLVGGGAFAVNVLSAHHADISVLCANGTAGENRFSIGDWDSAHGLPWLRDAQAVFFCDSAAQMTHGTHLIVVGNVRALRVQQQPVNPLLYADGQYRQLN